jgi:hypothetical protein
MPRFEQFEIWKLTGEQWELVAWFQDFAVASAVAGNYSYRMRLVHAVFEDGARTHEDVLAEVGATREHP